MQKFNVTLTAEEIAMIVSFTIQVRGACNRHEYENDAQVYGTALSIEQKLYHLWQQSGEPEFQLERRDASV